MSLEDAKKAVGTFAARFAQENMRIGLGTGSTAFYFIQELIKRHREGLHVEVVASSHASHLMAEQGGLPLIDWRKVSHLDLMVDGADAIDPAKRMLKGAGGALLREKICAYMSHQMLVIVDESKLVPSFLGQRLPVEILPFGAEGTLAQLQKLGYHGAWRMQKDALYKTDNGNYIFDITLQASDVAEVHEALIQLPGVVETGFFFPLAEKIFVGYRDGRVETR